MMIELIPATENDRAFFRRAHHLAYRDVIESMFGWDEKAQDAFADIDFTERNPHIIMHKGKCIGVIGWQNKPDHTWFGPIFILPEHQKTGIGSHIVKQFIKEAQAKGLPLRLQTLRQNHGAKRLYERLGFNILSATDIHWQMEFTPMV